MHFPFSIVAHSVNIITTSIMNSLYMPPTSHFTAACGDGPDEERAALNFSIPFQKITSPLDLYAVPALLHKDFAMEIPEEFCALNPTVKPTSKLDIPFKPISMSEISLKSEKSEKSDGLEIPETLENPKPPGGEEMILPSDAAPLVIDIPVVPAISKTNGQDSVIKIDRELFLDCHKKLITYTSSISRSHITIETKKTEKIQEQLVL